MGMDVLQPSSCSLRSFYLSEPPKRYLNLRARPLYRNDHSSTTRFRAPKEYCTVEKGAVVSRTCGRSNPSRLESARAFQPLHLASVATTRPEVSQARITVRYECGAEFLESLAQHTPQGSPLDSIRSGCDSLERITLSLPKPCGEATCLQKWAGNLQTRLDRLEDEYVRLGVQYFTCPLVEDETTLRRLEAPDLRLLSNTFGSVMPLATMLPKCRDGCAGEPEIEPEVPSQKYEQALEHLRSATYHMAHLPGFEKGVRDTIGKLDSCEVGHVVQDLKEAKRGCDTWAAELASIREAVGRVTEALLHTKECAGGKAIREKRAKHWLLKVPGVVKRNEKGVEILCSEIFRDAGLFGTGDGCDEENGDITNTNSPPEVLFDTDNDNGAKLD